MDDMAKCDPIQLWEAAMLAQSLSPRTVKERVRIVRQFSRQTGIDAHLADPQIIVAWLSTFAHPSTRHSYYVQLGAYFSFLARFDIRLDNPMRKLLAPRRPKSYPRPVTYEQIVTVLNSGTCYATTKRKILFGALAGLRAHEIAKLNGSAYDSSLNELTVVGKGGRVDVIPLHPNLAALAQSLPRRGYWFPAYGTNSRHITGQAVTQAISGAFRRCGIDATAHQLRHYFATSLVQAGVDLRTVQTLMRHDQLSTTAIYTQINPTRQVQALAALPSLTQVQTSLF